jgi:hypothetical protein
MILKFFYHIEKRLLTRERHVIKATESGTDDYSLHPHLVQEILSEMALVTLQLQIRWIVEPLLLIWGAL